LYTRNRTPGIVGDAGLASNRGLAILGDKIFMVTDDAHMLALNRTTGKPVWEAVMPEKGDALWRTAAPLVLKHMVIGGVAGGDWGVRGFLAAYRASDGKLLWRHWTVPATGESGAETWGGNPPETAEARRGPPVPMIPRRIRSTGPRAIRIPTEMEHIDLATIFTTNSILALNPDDGKLKWFIR
jgi:outer membrane protein assembly factor BamB